MSDKQSDKQYDVIVIGSGPGGYVAALRCAELGMRTACVEKEATVGGTCLNVGCIPSKALLQSSEYYEWIGKESAQHGIDVSSAKFSLEKMMERKEGVVKGLVDSVANLLKNNKVAHYRGAARFKSSHLLEIEGPEGRQVIQGENIIIATGSEPIPLPFLPFDEKQVLSSTGALMLKQVPKKMIVIGAGVIGVELASVWRRLGAEITIIEMLDTICPAMDQAVSRLLQRTLRSQGLDFHLSAKVEKADVTASSVTLTVTEEGKQLQYTADCVLVAIGRRPYTADLGLKEFGIQTDAKGFITVDGNFRSSLPNVYAIGDVIEGPMLAHRASAEGVAAAEIIAGRKAHVNYLTIPNVIYTHPEVAAVGMTEKEAKDAGLDLLVGTSQMRGNARARCSGYTEGIVKVIGEKNSGALIGMHIMAPHASEIIGEGMVAIAKRASIADLATAPHAHPTLSEAIQEAAKAAMPGDRI